MADVRLGIANLGPNAVRRFLHDRLVGRDLHDQEREIALAERVPPIGNHGRQQGSILIRASGVRFALIPDGALNGVRRQGRDHGIVEHAGALRL
jgi:hypothetical protein